MDATDGMRMFADLPPVLQDLIRDFRLFELPFVGQVQSVTVRPAYGFTVTGKLCRRWPDTGATCGLRQIEHADGTMHPGQLCLGGQSDDNSFAACVQVLRQFPCYRRYRFPSPVFAAFFATNSWSRICPVTDSWLACAAA